MNLNEAKHYLGGVALKLAELEQIIHIKGEIDSLARRIEDARKPEYVSDYAKDYSTGYERVISVSGYASPDYEKVGRLTAQRLKRKEELEALVLAAEDFISSIPDGKTRTLLSLRYLEGMEWNDVAKRIYKKMTGDAARKSVARFFGGESEV